MKEKVEEFIYRANPNEWLEVADELNYSIEIILKNSSVSFHKCDVWDGVIIKKLMSSRSIFLLMGFCLENLIKGILVFDNPQLINTDSIGLDIKSHNISHLIKKVDIILNDKETEFLTNLSEAIPVWGRYPSPLKFQHLNDEVLYVDEITPIFQSLKDQLKLKLISRLKIGWISGNENTKTNVQIIDYFEIG